MIDLNNITSFTLGQPPAHNPLGTAAEFLALPETHQQQILFLNKEGSRFVDQLGASAHLLTGDVWDPFEKGNFKTVETFNTFYYDGSHKQELKKWLYQRGIPFRSWTFVRFNGNDDPMMMTWKMVIKYCTDLFIMNDVMIFDQTRNWCLFFFHEDKLFFGKDNIYDNTDDEKMMEELNERKKKFPLFKHPYH